MRTAPLTQQEEMRQVEITIEEARKFIAIGDAIERLEKNEDFKKVIFDGYFVEEAARVTSLLADPSMQRPEMQTKLHHALRAISEFKQHLLTTKLMVEQFRSDLEDNLNTLEDLRVEVANSSDPANLADEEA